MVERNTTNITQTNPQTPPSEVGYWTTETPPAAMSYSYLNKYLHTCANASQKRYLPVYTTQKLGTYFNFCIDYSKAG